MEILGVFLLLSFLVLIHEWGHYIAAKKTGVRVEEFGFGYPPRALTMFTRKGTVFTLNWLPFGGFVRLAGDDAESFEQMAGADKASANKTGASKAEKSAKKNVGLFSSASRINRLFVVLAGACINLLFGVLIFAFLYTWAGAVSVNLPRPRVDEVISNSPAQKAGFVKGDEVISLNGVATKTSAAFIERIQTVRGQQISVVVARDGKNATLTSYVRTEKETPDGQGGLGIMLIDVEFRHYPAWQMPFYGMVQGVKDSYMFSGMIVKTLGRVVGDLVRFKGVASEVSGPIGIVNTARKEKLFEQGPQIVLNFAALISINLGVVNVLPIPPLDGGRALFILLEGILGKKRRAKLEYYTNQAGMLFFLALIVLISIKDVFAIFAGK
ncbi:MAG TPA: hypothetical protein DCX25_04000 [Candidatus Pacebacteria bacterium]|nr:MAG: Membrane-associated zinc metalloprotease [Microgenomates group bacterium GW2011_GWB1_45_17]KKU24198.1 MAG: Membrane-associated zinc metalloprotease [Microgenomates group bacterium GW2011_GWC1_46_15]KKU24914.1 MAG: Membrane-associated zinc metalloprotease [Microgenomates group bacterium GW2011_GWA1_46_15]HAV15469.1 hypothetical protein [Candidatus Paceibacterota bacterium]HCR11419.1 hypothetical protein [Candidatus Paceibacterota bacterium]